MVTKSSTMQAAKRKKTDDMADSPPKRVTRARAMKATEDLDLPPEATTTRKTTRKATVKSSESRKIPSAKSRTISSNTSASAGVKKHKVRTYEAEEKNPDREAPPKSEGNADLQAPATAARSSRAKVEKKSTESAEQAGTRGLRTRAGTAREVVKRPVSSTANNKKAPIEMSEAKSSEEALPKKFARPVRTAARPEQTTTRTRAMTGRSTSSKTVAKKVKFQEETDKENVPLEVARSTKSATKATGLKAKPVRKPPVPRASTRTRKTLQQKEDDQVERAQKQMLPLSPKKIHQVAKADSASSEDELAGNELPATSPKRSPVKQCSAPVNIATQPQETTDTIQEVPASPSKTLSFIGLASPARRPPHPPVRDGLALSPKRIGLDFSPSKPVMQVTLQKSPAKLTLLQESPRKGKLPSSPVKSTLNAPFSPTKSSIVRSPARRPPLSPFKCLPPQHGHSSLVNPNSMVMSNELHGQEVDTSLPNPFQAVRDPQNIFSVQQLSSEILTPQSPVKAHSSNAQSRPAKDRNLQNPECEDPDEANATKDTQEIEMIDIHEDEADDTLSPAFCVRDNALRRVSMETDSTDELASPDKKYAPTPLTRHGSVALNFATPSTAVRAALDGGLKQNVSFTPLLGKLSGWAASTPKTPNPALSLHQDQSQASTLDNSSSSVEHHEFGNAVSSPAKSTFFEDEMAVRVDFRDEDSVLENGLGLSMKDACPSEAVASEVAQSVHDSFSSEEYGDENAVPSIAEVIREEQDAQNQTPTCTPAKVFTPARKQSLRSQEVHTVSKVPLRAPAEESPFKAPRQRSRSFGGPLAVLPESQPKLSQISESTMNEVINGNSPTPKVNGPPSPLTPISGMKLNAETPGRTIRKGVIPDVLKGAIVFVDVHTSEGADASGIFIDLLTQMGARCVKQWSWNPRASVGDSLDGVAPATDNAGKPSLPMGKVGITHVVYKDGGKRTLEKVKASDGVVLCVGVGWVLE